MVGQFHEEVILMVDSLVQKIENTEDNKNSKKIENTEDNKDSKKIENTEDNKDSRKTENPTSPSTATLKLKVMISILTTCMEIRGVTGLENLNVIHLNGGDERALVITKDVKKGDIISTTPVGCCISARMFDLLPQPPPPYQTFEERPELTDPETSETRKRILLLLHACSKSANHYLKAYIKSLPVSFPSMPLYWTKRQREQCGPGSMVASLQDRMCLEIQTAHQNLTPIINESKHLFDTEKWTLDFCAWTYSCLNSRTFSLNMKSTQIKEQMLIPLYDMMNHTMTDYNVQVCEDPEETEGKIVLLATRDIKAGEKLKNCYRLGDNSRMLVYYGFVIENNPYDVVFVRVKYKEIGLVLGMAMGSLGLPPSEDVAIPLTMDDPLPQTWIWALRLREMDEEQLQAFIEGQVKFTGKQELRIWRMINKEIQRQVKWYTDAQEKLTNWKKSSRKHVLDVMYTCARSVLVRTMEYHEKNAPEECEDPNVEKEKKEQKEQQEQKKQIKQEQKKQRKHIKKQIKKQKKKDKKQKKQKQMQSPCTTADSANNITDERS